MKAERAEINRQDIATRRSRELTEDERLQLAWLAGFLDGEGTIALSHGSRRTPNLRIVVYNTSPLIIAKARAILDALEIGYFVRWDRRWDNHCASIRIGNEGTLRLHQFMRPYLVRQVERYDAAVAFLGHRYLDRKRVYWTAEEMAAWDAIRAQFNRA